MQPENEHKEPKDTKKPSRRSAPGWPKGLDFSDRKQIAVSIATDLAVMLSQKAFSQLFGWAYSTSREISCLGAIRRQGNLFMVEEFYLLKQSGSSAGTELDQDAIAKLMEELLAAGKQEHLGSIKCWAHSHPGMGVFWSGTDEETCNLLVNDYLVSIVISDGFTVKCRIDTTSPVPITLDNVPVLYDLPQDADMKGKLAEEVKAAVSERTFFEFDEPNQAAKQPTGEKPVEATGFGPMYYCELCGMHHGEFECPLDDRSVMHELFEDGYCY